MTTDDRPIFLVGFMGSGKSAVGAALSGRLNRELRDTDEMVVEREERSIEAIFDQAGEGYFRAIEWEILQSLEGRRGVVVAAGGGLFLGWLQRRWIKERGRSVWLDVPLDVVRRRLVHGTGRPLWAGRDPLDFRVFFENRRAAYALADVRIEAHPGSPEEIARRVLERLERISR